MNVDFHDSVMDYLTSIVKSHNANVYVDRSWIPNGGYGLFAQKNIKKDDVVISYIGEILNTQTALRRNDKSYLMRLGTQVYIDANNCFLCLARYINDCRNPAGHNVIFDKNEYEKCAKIIATRNIYLGEELYVDYGKWYWISIKDSYKMTFNNLHINKSKLTNFQYD